MAIYTGGVSQLEWREVDSGNLPTPREYLRVATVDNIIHVTGGYNGHGNYLTAILSWDPTTESWQEAGNLKVGREEHAALAVSSSIIESECSI